MYIVIVKSGLRGALVCCEGGDLTLFTLFTLCHCCQLCTPPPEHLPPGDRQYFFVQCQIFAKLYLIHSLFYLFLFKGKGKPVDMMMSNYQAVPLPETSPEIAKDQFERSGGKLKNFGSFGTDPLLDNPQLQEIREKEFSGHTPSFNYIFNAVANNNHGPLAQAIIKYIEITRQLSMAC